MLRKFLITAVRFYQGAISWWTMPACRFTPTCSSYCIGAIEKYGPARGGWLALKRIWRCHPWGGHGLDPVPDQADARPRRRLADRPDGVASTDRLMPG